MKIALLKRKGIGTFPVQVMAVSVTWAMVRRKGAMPFCVMVKELNDPTPSIPTPEPKNKQTIF